MKEKNLRMSMSLLSRQGGIKGNKLVVSTLSYLQLPKAVLCSIVAMLICLWTKHPYRLWDPVRWGRWGI